MPVLKQDVVAKRIYENSKQRLQLVSEYKGRKYPVVLHCLIHDIDFEVSGESAAREPIRCNCPQCTQELKDSMYSTQRIEVQCAYCGKSFTKPRSRLNCSKSGLYFCCREHKDLAQRLNSGVQFDVMRPDHYGTINSKCTYRNQALNAYPHKCAVCGWDEDVDILQVHHIDENRENNDINNLIILCPTCHWKITMHKYKLTDDHTIVLNKE